MKKNTFFTNGTEVFFVDSKEWCKITPAEAAKRGDDGKVFWVGRSAGAELVNTKPENLKKVVAGQSFANGKIIVISENELAVEKMTLTGVDYRGYDIKVDEYNYSETVTIGTMVFNAIGGVRVK